LSKHAWTAIALHMRKIYEAPIVEAAEAHFEDFAEPGRVTYPAMIGSWENEVGGVRAVPRVPSRASQDRLHNAIESLNARFRQAVRHRGHFPNEQAALKVLYLVATISRQNRENTTGRIHGWKHILNALTVHDGDRMTMAALAGSRQR
jgi:putative transposase